MTEIKNGREVETLPRNFEGVKREFQKLLNIYLSRNRELVSSGEHEWDNKDVYEPTKEGLALLWILMEELSAFFDAKEGEIVEQLLTKMGDNKEVFLKDYGLSVKFDDEAQWLFKSDITKAEWQKLDKEDNEKYLAERKDN